MTTNPVPVKASLLTVAGLAGAAAVATAVYPAPSSATIQLADLTSAGLEAAMASPACETGCRLELPCRAIVQITRPLNVCKPIAIEGCDAGRDDSARTRLSVRGSTLGIALRFGPWCMARGLGPGASGARLSGIQVAEAVRPAVPRARVGVLVEAPEVTLERVDVSGFGTGILIDAGAKRGASKNVVCSSAADCPTGWACDRKLCKPGSATNANGTRLVDVSVKGTDHAGALVRGPDANAGSFDSVSVIHACKRAAAIEALGSDAPGWPAFLELCAGVVDHSFLGNTWTAPHVADPVDETGVARPAYAVIGDSNRTVLVGAYAEEDSAPSILAPNAIAIGGKSHWASGGGLVLSGRVVTRPVLVAPTLRSARARADSVTPLARIEVDGTSEWWSWEYDGRATSPHQGWLRTLYRASSSAETEAWKGGVWR